MSFVLSYSAVYLVCKYFKITSQVIIAVFIVFINYFGLDKNTTGSRGHI